MLKQRLTKEDLSQIDGSEQKEGVDLSLFQAEPFVLLKKEHDLHNRALLLCREHRFTPKVSIYPNQLMTAFNIAIHGLGCTFVTDTLVKRCPFDHELVYYHIAALSQELISRKVFIAQKRNRYSTRAMRNFIELAHAIFLKEAR